MTNELSKDPSGSRTAPYAISAEEITIDFKNKASPEIKAYYDELILRTKKALILAGDARSKGKDRESWWIRI